MVPAAAEAALAACANALTTDREACWRRENAFDPDLVSAVLKSRSALLGAGHIDICFSRLQCVVNTAVGKYKCGAVIEAFWRRIMKGPDVLPCNLWDMFLQVSLTTLRKQCRPICLGSTMQRLLAAGAVREWPPKLQHADPSERQGTWAGVGHVGLRQRLHYKAGHWLILLDCANAFSTV